MAFEYEVDNLDGMDAAMANNYIKVGDKYRLDVNGVEDVTGLKNSVTAIRKERDAFELQLKESTDAKAAIDAEKLEAERLRLVEKGEFKTLAEQSQAKELETATKLSELEAKIADGERIKTALETTAGMTKDPARAEMLKEQALKYIQSTPEGVKIVGPTGDMDAAGLTAHLTATLPFLVDGSQSGGGGSQGGGSGGGGQGNMGGTKTERAAALKAKFPELN